MNTPPKGRPTPAKTLTRSVPPTIMRRFTDAGHHQPSGRHAGGRAEIGVWKGAARIMDRPAKRRANRQSWRKLQAARRG